MINALCTEPTFVPSLAAMSSQQAQPDEYFVYKLSLMNLKTLGLVFSSADQNNGTLVVEKIEPDGLIEAWNKQCWELPDPRHGPEEAVQTKDQILVINGESKAVAMLNQIRTRRFLKMTVGRRVYYQEQAYGYSDRHPMLMPGPTEQWLMPQLQ